LHHVAEREGLLSLTLPFNGDPVSAAAVDNFAFEVKARFARKLGTAAVRRFQRGNAGNSNFPQSGG